MTVTLLYSISIKSVGVGDLNFILGAIPNGADLMVEWFSLFLNS